MEVVTMVLVFLLAVAVSRILVGLLPLKLPLPILQIAIGAALSYVIGFNVRLEPDIFFLVFIAPLLSADGWRIPKDTLSHDWRAIVTLALGLVIFTVIGVGFLIGAMIPKVPLAVAFALAAILSPTDPVAVSAITSGTAIPSRLMHILEGEALFNDASGLVCFNFAVMAALTGSFSLPEASLTFLRLALGGLFTGVVISWGASFFYRKLTRGSRGESGTPILISILVPFAAYLAAEHVHFSGILAAVASGIAGNYADLIAGLIGRSSAETRMYRSTVWDMLQVALNGIIFILLGAQIPHILASVPDIDRAVGIANPWWLAFYVLVIVVALAVLRFVWVWASLEGARFLAWRRGKAQRRPPLRLPLVAAFAGVKGAITLAGILTLPLVMLDGAAFPARDLAIFLAMGVILASLLMASVGLPAFAKGLPLPDQLPASGREQSAREAATEAAIRHLEGVQGQASGGDAEVKTEAAARVIGLYRRRLDREHARGDDAEHANKLADAERRLRLEALRAERDELYRLRLSRQIDDLLHRRLVRELDLEEASLSASSVS